MSPEREPRPLPAGRDLAKGCAILAGLFVFSLLAFGTALAMVVAAVRATS